MLPGRLCLILIVVLTAVCFLSFAGEENVRCTSERFLSYIEYGGPDTPLKFPVRPEPCDCDESETIDLYDYACFQNSFTGK